MFPDNFINQIIEGDCQEILKQIPDNSVDICTTSPPYKLYDGYSDQLLVNCFKELYRILKPSTLFFLNFGHLNDSKFRPFLACQIALQLQFKLRDTIVWSKNHFTPLPGNNLNNMTEFVFMLYKGEMPNIDRLSIGVPYQDKSNAKRYNKGVDLRCRGNLWHIPHENISKKSDRLHKDMFPLMLPEMCIKLSGLKSGILIDPFSGAGTSCLAAKNLGLNYTGIELNKKYVDISKERLS